MPEVEEHGSNVQESLQQVLDLLHRNDLIESLVRRQEMPRHELVESLVHKQNLALLKHKLDEMHPADVGYILESLPLDQRLVVWDLIRPERDGEILLEVSDAVRETLIRTMDADELLAAAGTLDTDEIADLAPDLPPDVMADLLMSLDSRTRARLQSALAFPEDTVGALMDFDFVTIREDIALEVVLRYLRRLDELPDQTDKLFIVDRDYVLKGVLPLNRLLVNDPEVSVAAVMLDDPITFRPDQQADEAAQAFERYDLVSAPVVDREGRLIGRLTVDAVVDFIREESEAEILNRAGLREEEDIFASVW
ncbi:MAG TPA: CBS domain-containing protein, partial [Burkholderiales bacterium]|nr:CBS domain-containing protein [Burkholderiales bacterium]